MLRTRLLGGWLQLGLSANHESTASLLFALCLSSLLASSSFLKILIRVDVSFSAVTGGNEEEIALAASDTLQAWIKMKIVTLVCMRSMVVT